MVACTEPVFTASPMMERAAPSRVWQEPTHIPVQKVQGNRLIGTLIVMTPISAVSYCLWWLLGWL